MNKQSLRPSRIMAGFYWVVVALFSALEPWGKIDTRDFSYMGQGKFWEYNAYIVFVLASMVALGVLLWNRRPGAKTAVWMAVANTMFAVMVLFDLLHFFPDPAQPLPFLVAVIEATTACTVLGMLWCIPGLLGKNS